MDQTTTNTQVSPDVASDDFLKTLQDKLLSQSEIISSEDTNIEKKITEAIGAVSKSNEASKGVIESQFGREMGEVRTAGERERTTFVESSRGFATNTAALEKIETDTEKSLRDLDQRKKELILAGDAAAAGKIADLQFKALEFRQEARQRMFSNLLSAGNFGIQAKQEARLSRAQSIAEKNAITELALTYGVPVKEGDTVETIAARAMPFATQKQQLEIQKMKAEISRINAEASKAMQGESSSIDPNVIDIIAKAGINNPSVLGLLKDVKQGAQVVNRMAELNAPRNFDISELNELGQAEFNSGTSFTEAMAKVASDARITNKADAEKVLRTIYNNPVKEKKSFFNWGGGSSSSNTKSSPATKTTPKYSSINFKPSGGDTSVIDAINKKISGTTGF